MSKYKRVLIKLSGEALANDLDHSILGAENLNKVVAAIKDIVNEGTQVCVVVGGGNIFRGRIAEEVGLERCTADYMGMLGTIINSLALQSVFANQGVKASVMLSMPMPKIAPLFDKKIAEEKLNEGEVVIFGGGTGNPYFSTDTTAALRACELNCEAILMAKNGVDGVYDDDPRVNKNAKFIEYLTFRELLNKNLKVMDNTAVTLCIDSNIELRVFNMSDYDNFKKVIKGDKIGTTINKGE